MPRLSSGFPRYSKHRASGQAVVRLSGEDFYLGPHGTQASKLEYDRQIAEWLARGRRPRASAGHSDLTVVELLADYKQHAEIYYRKNGELTSEVKQVVLACKVVIRLYGRELADDFGPLKLQAVQHAMIRAGWSRKNINKQVGRVVRIFKWAVSKEMVRPDLEHSLRTVAGLQQGRSEAKESVPVLPVADSLVNATLDHVSPIVADMVRLQRLTGCRPEELCLLRPCDVDTSVAVWAYRPESHKTAHHSRERVIFIGPKGQDVLRPYLLREKSSYCFCPAEGERKRRLAASEKRQTPLSCGNVPGSNRRRRPAKAPGDRYTSDSYRRAIHRACDLAFGMPGELRKATNGETSQAKAERLKLAKQWRDKYRWSPNQLRHSAATEIRKRFGLEAAQVTLGHAAADVTQVYAERDMERAAQVMAAVG
jgi:integrase